MEHYDAKRRKTELQRVRKIVAFNSFGLHAAAVADTAAAVFSRVAVENLFPESHARNSYSVTESRNRREVRGAKDVFFIALAFAKPHNNAVVLV